MFISDLGLSCHACSFVPTFKSLNIVECREFRVLLLLLRNELKEAMIPHRTKIRELIIQAWKRYFVVLQKDLEVCCVSVNSFNTFFLFPYPECRG
jgi:hypothetical protein